MMGISVPDVDLPIIKNNNAILAFKNSQPSYTKTTACIRCGKCTRVCPVKLMPAALERAYDNRNSEALKSLKVNLCINLWDAVLIFVLQTGPCSKKSACQGNAAGRKKVNFAFCSQA